MIFAVFMTIVTFLTINFLGVSDLFISVIDGIGVFFYGLGMMSIWEFIDSISYFLNRSYFKEIVSALATIPFAIVFINLSYKYE